MTADDIEKIAKIMLTADNWREACARDLLQQLAAAFPEHVKTISAVKKRAANIQAEYDKIDGALWIETGDHYPVWCVR